MSNTSSNEKKMSSKKTTTSTTAYNTRAKAAAAASAAANKKGVKAKDNYTIHMSSDEEDDDDEDLSYESEEEEDDEDDEGDSVSDYIDSEEDELETAEYKKFLYDLFPSQYMKDKVNTTTKNFKAAAAAYKNKKPAAPLTRTAAPAKKKKSSKSRRKVEEEEEDEEEEEEEEDDEDEYEDAINALSSKFNISFIVDGMNQSQQYGKESLFDEDDYDEEEDSEDEESESESESEEEEEEVEEETLKSKKKSAVATPTTSANDETALAKMKELFKTLTPDEKNSPVVKGFLNNFKEREQKYLKKVEKKSRKQKKENTQKLKKLLREKDVMNDLKFFHKNLSLPEQQTVLEQIELIHKNSYVDKPYRLRLLDADIPLQYKACAYRKISTLRHMEPGGGEYFKMKNWVDTFMQIPFGKHKNLPISLKADGVEKCHEFMDNAKKILDQAVYGLDDAKLQIMQMIGQWIVNPEAIGTSIAIKGPMGTGKTTLVKEGISKILGRDFAFIALGGATDSSFLEGHSYTYEGSSWGKIVDLLINCKSMNPVIYFDELDKISDTPKGEEIVGILTHLTDTTQNNQFHDRYFSEIDFDLSRCLFIFSYNDESKVNRILLDRMYKIQTKGYNQEQKTTIANNYLLPKICEQVVFKTEDICIPEATMHYIITNYTDKEDGVRTLKRCLEIIHTKLNLYRLMKPGTNLFESEMSIKVEFPMQVTPTVVDQLIKKDVDNGHWKNMYN